ncbi:MAG TPA: helix-turn-helix domain-containing protein [Candidatus Alectryocaccomicrobium excrementavium]|uniref:Stage 0 sporulation protein A homolog n=1 Tax=Candidatus Alectryocaccomicrobium excrementavium TaxID=2840668 RepID=A0A9D1K6G0_9FIRM|nr:helix-turn-helix domain-containing protein [Candidatus Alectryocaccomicrobium excrementavium]
MDSLLIVDDQIEVRRQIRSMLQKASLEPKAIFEAGTVASALELIRQKRPSLLLLDVILPDGTGFDVLRELSGAGEELSVIMMTAFPQFDYAMQAINSHVKGFLVKPLEISEFTRMILSVQGAEFNEKKTHLSYTLLDNYLRGRQINIRLNEIREQTGINRLTGAHYLALIASVEPSAALEKRMLHFWALQRQEGIQSVTYLQDTTRLVALLRTDDPPPLRERLARLLKEAFGYFIAGCASPDAECGIRRAYLNAEFALRYAKSLLIHGQIVSYASLNAADILIEEQRASLLDASGEAAEKLVLEFARQGVSPAAAAQALERFCHKNGMPGVSLNAASLGQLSISFKQALANAPKADSRKNSVQLARVKRYVDDHFTENINRSSIARALGISYSYVGDLFQKEMKISLTEYLLNLRMERAMELLRQTRLSVAEIARRVCYVDSKSFIRAFQKKTGCTPGEWRILNRENGRP